MLWVESLLPEWTENQFLLQGVADKVGASLWYNHHTLINEVQEWGGGGGGGGGGVGGASARVRRHGQLEGSKY